MPCKDRKKEKERLRKHYLENREKFLRRARIRYRLMREELKAYARAYRRRNRASVQATIMNWRKTNGRVKWTEACRRREAAKVKAAIPLTKEEKKQIYTMERRRLRLKSTTGKMYHIDHIVPLIHGGVHHPANLRVLSISKNSRKGGMITPESIALVAENYRLYRERSGVKKAEWFRRKISKAIGVKTANRLIGRKVMGE